MSAVRLATVLVQAGVVPKDSAEELLADAARSGQSLSATLVERGVVDQEALLDKLASVSQVPRLDRKPVPVDPQVGRYVTQEWASHHRALPVALDRNKRRLFVAVTNPLDLGPLDELALRSETRIETRLVSESALDALLERAFAPPPDPNIVNRLLKEQERSARELQTLFELCVARGLIDPKEYLERLAHTPED